MSSWIPRRVFLWRCPRQDVWGDQGSQGSQGGRGEEGEEGEEGGCRLRAPLTHMPMSMNRMTGIPRRPPSSCDLTPSLRPSLRPKGERSRGRRQQR